MGRGVRSTAKLWKAFLEFIINQFSAKRILLSRRYSDSERSCRAMRDGRRYEWVSWWKRLSHRFRRKIWPILKLTWTVWASKRQSARPWHPVSIRHWIYNAIQIRQNWIRAKWLATKIKPPPLATSNNELCWGHELSMWTRRVSIYFCFIFRYFVPSVAVRPTPYPLTPPLIDIVLCAAIQSMNQLVFFNEIAKIVANGKSENIKQLSIIAFVLFASIRLKIISRSYVMWIVRDSTTKMKTNEPKFNE